MTSLTATVRLSLLAAALAAPLALPQGATAQVVTPAPQTAPQPETPFEMPRADDPPPGAPSDPLRFPDIQRAPGEAPSPLDELMNNMLRRAQPHLEDLARDMGGLVNDYAPVFEELGRLMDDIGNYELPPERLPNGDILIRRKAGAPPPPPLEELPNFLPRDRSPGTAPEGETLPQTPSGQVEL